jgi:hypothetical protein
MSARNRSLAGLAACAALFAAVSACSPTPPPSPKLMARCTQLYALWYRYGQHATFHHTGQRARAELALHECQNGRYEASLSELELLLQRNRIPVPPP